MFLGNAQADIVKKLIAFPSKIQFGPLSRAGTLLSSYLTSGSHGNGQRLALVGAQPQGDAVRPLS